MSLIAWARAAVTLIRDLGSPGGLTLEVPIEHDMPWAQAAGRFLAPEGRYYPELLGAPVSEAELVRCALAEIDRGRAPGSRSSLTSLTWL